MRADDTENTNAARLLVGPSRSSRVGSLATASRIAMTVVLVAGLVVAGLKMVQTPPSNSPLLAEQTNRSAQVPALRGLMVTPSMLSSGGGRAVLHVWLPKAGACHLVALPAVRSLVNIAHCPRGVRRIAVMLPANATGSQMEYTFRLTGSGGWAWGTVIVAGEPAGVAPVVASTTPTTTAPTSTTTTTTTTPGTPTTVPHGTEVLNQNWSGYQQQAGAGSVFSSVAGTWTVPSISCTGTPNSKAAAWIGIGDTTIQQEGTTAQCVGGHLSYFAWVEMWGDPQCYGGYQAVYEPAVYPVHAGDVLRGEVLAPSSVSPGHWLFQMRDLSAGWSLFFIVAAPAKSDQSVAEWILERPSTCPPSGCTIDQLPNSGKFAFRSTTAALAGSNSTSTPTTVEMEMSNATGTVMLANPGPLDPASASFSEAW